MRSASAAPTPALRARARLGRGSDHARPAARGDGGGGVRGGVVHDHELEGVAAQGLRRERAQERRQGVGRVVRRDDDGDLHRPATSSSTATTRASNRGAVWRSAVATPPSAPRRNPGSPARRCTVPASPSA